MPLKVKHDNIVSNYALSEQKYRLVIPFAENNFGPFAHIVFVIVLFESPSKTLLRVLMHQSIPAATIPPPGQPPGIGKFSFFSCKCPGVGQKKRNNAPPSGRKTKQMPHPRADKLVNFKECTKLITCVLTICIYTP